MPLNQYGHGLTCDVAILNDDRATAIFDKKTAASDNIIKFMKLNFIISIQAVEFGLDKGFDSLPGLMLPNLLIPRQGQSLSNSTRAREIDASDSNGTRRETLRPYLAIDRDKDDTQIGNPAWDAGSRKNGCEVIYS
ncbi:hypothetical protein V8E54_009933 [Elaphomyces granulatus]